MPVSRAMTGHPQLKQLLRGHRLRADLTLEALAERSGISDRTISDIERGVSMAPHRRTILAVADALQLSRLDRDVFLAAAGESRRIPGGDGRATDLAPHRVVDFTGRTGEVKAVVDRLSPTGDDPPKAVPLVIICGAPGVGKTTVAVEALAHDGARRPQMLFVQLGGLDAMPLPPLKVLQALLRQADPQHDAPTVLSTAATAWHAFTSTSPVAVLLDDAATEAQIRPVLGAGRGSAVVVTSRRSLAGLEGAGRITLGSLPATDSEELLRKIIPAQQALTGDIPELARLCDHNPLALRIAGNRLASQPQWTVEDYAERLRSEGKRLRVLVAGDLAVESAIALSYDNLDPPAQEVFRNLSLIDGPSFDATIAAAIGPGDPDATEESLDTLANLGLIAALRGNRFRIHDLLRLFAAACLRSEVPAADISARRSRLREWLLATAKAMGQRLMSDEAFADAPGATSDDARAWLMTESEHWYAAFKAAASMGAFERVIELAEALHSFAEEWSGWGHWPELYKMFGAAAASVGDPAAQTRQLHYLARAQTLAGRTEANDGAARARLAQ